ncbi:probable Ankyrin repeat and IBR domain-containing protein 1 [Coccomyxa sp. Obi]|nr:probable Ankyrin repeat and IBR domain-containing protein 1 [Coccomyxa sp. Obi]
MGNQNRPDKRKLSIPGKQLELRRACQTGDIRKVASLLSAQQSLWKVGVQRLVGSWVLRRFGVQEDWLAPARLDFVYDDEEANMPIHYIALGSPVSLVSRLLSSLCIRSPGAGHASDRAELLRFLLDKGYDLDLASVNARLETPLHCALRSRSLEILEVLLTYRLATGAARPGAPVTEKDSESRRPLDMALVSQQWPAVRLLIAAGALSKCPELEDARRELDQLLPAADVGGKHGGNVLSVLPNALGKVFNFVLRQGQDSRPSTEAIRESTSADLAAQADPDTSTSARIEPTTIVLADNAEVARHQQKSVEHIKFVLDVNHARAVALLEANQWNEHRTVDAYFSDAEGALRAAGVSTDSEASTSEGPSVSEASAVTAAAQTCIVCFEVVASKKMSIMLPCGHITCDTCWKGILNVRLSEGDVHRTGCPFVGCNCRLSFTDAQRLLSKSQKERYEQLLAQNYADTNPAIKWCPRAGCGRCLTVDARVGAADGVAAAAGSGRALDVRCSCGHAFCFSCLRAPHEPATCAAVREWETLVAVVNKEEKERADCWLARNTKPCGGCGAPIQKNGGCNHMVCSRCRRHFCWVCGGDWASHNSATGGYYKCNRFKAAAEAEAASQGAGSGGVRAFLGNVFGRIQDAATRFRFNYYLRRYQASECDARLLHVAAEWTSALLTAGLPLDHGNQDGAAEAGISQAPDEAAKVASPPARVGLGEILDDLSDETTTADEPGPSSPAMSPAAQSTGAQSAAGDAPGSADGLPQTTLCTPEQPEETKPTGAMVGADFGYLKVAATEAIAARDVLRSSYIAGFSLAWGDRRRHFEEIQGRLESATEQCSVPLALLPDVQAILQSGDCRPQPQDSSYLPPTRPQRPLPVHVQDGEMLRRQFYFALAVHERCQQLRSLAKVVAAEKRLLLTSARRGSFEERGEQSMDAAVATGLLPLTGMPPEEPHSEGGGIGGALQTAGAALAYFWQGG